MFTTHTGRGDAGAPVGVGFHGDVGQCRPDQGAQSLPEPVHLSNPPPKHKHNNEGSLLILTFLIKEQSSRYLLPAARLHYLAEAPELAAPDQPGGDLAHTALGALVGIAGQLLQVRPQQRQQCVAVVAKQPLSIKGLAKPHTVFSATEGQIPVITFDAREPPAF